MDKAEQVYEKLAKLNISNFEDNYLAGVMLSDSGEQKAKKLYAEKVSGSFPLRHPYLTGIPTLGIVPMIAEDKAKDSVARKLLQQDKILHSKYEKYREAKKQYMLEKYKADAVRPKSNQTIVNVDRTEINS